MFKIKTTKIKPEYLVKFKNQIATLVDEYIENDKNKIKDKDGGSNDIANKFI